MVTRAEIAVPEQFQGYLNSISEETIEEALRRNTRRFKKLLKGLPKKKINYAYAEGKWTIKEMLQHIVDTERVFNYRALHFSRKDAAPLPPFDENIWAIHAKGPKRSWGDLVDEFTALRAATELFFASLDDEQLRSTGTANNKVLSAAAMGFLCAGHVQHHMNVIKERYLGETPKKKKKKEWEI